MAKFVSSSNLNTVITKIKALLDGKVSTREGYGLSQNDFTDDLKTKLNAMPSDANHYEHPAQPGVTVGATYRSVTVDANGHITAGTNPTTLDGYGITSLDATLLTGTVPIGCIPAAAMERCVVVENEAAMLALTTENAQLGDTVKVTATNTMFMIVDEAKLGTKDAFVEYTAGHATTASSADSVAWSGVTGKPNTMKNPNSISIVVDGESTSYDGESTASVNIDAITVEDIEKMFAGTYGQQ